MDLGTVLIVIGIILAVVAMFITQAINSYRLLAAAVVLIGIGALLLEGGLKTG